MEELKPCPFCGERVTIYYSSAKKGFFFMHRRNGECILLTPSPIVGKYKSLAEAYEAWNRRGKE